MSSERTATWDAAPSLSEPSGPQAYLTGLDGEPALPIALPRGLLVRVGRESDCGIQLDHNSVSRHHATLRFEGGTTFELVDRGSRNGTFVNGRRVEGRVCVDAGSEVRFGDRRVLLAVRAGGGHTARAEPPVAVDPRMRAAVDCCERVAATGSSVLLVGETGTGKEVLARWIHEKSLRAAGPFVAIDCGAIPDSLAAAELFGHEKGAFSGASCQRAGHFEVASGGTLFLDGVSELSPANQTKLLRALQERKIMRVGSTRTIDVDVRVIAATHRPLDMLVREGSFREDLQYRLDVVRVDVPPLRERGADLPGLVEALLVQLAPHRKTRLAPDALEALRAHPWPGNVRQLRNALERVNALGEREVIRACDLLEIGDEQGSGRWALDGRVAEVEREALLDALAACGGNQSAAARRLGISRRALIYRIEKHGLREPGAS